MLRVMFNRLPVGGNGAKNTGDALVKAWEVFRDTLTSPPGPPLRISPGVTPAALALIPRIIVLLTENPLPTVGPDVDATKAIANFIGLGQFSGDANNPQAVGPSDFPYPVPILTIGMDEWMSENFEKSIICVLCVFPFDRSKEPECK